MTMGAHPIAASDILVSEPNRKLQYILRSSKTHNEAHQPQIVTIISASRSSADRYLNKYCPCQIILTCANSRLMYVEDNDPFFVFRDGSPVMPSHYRRRLNRALMDIRLEVCYYGYHSMRIGRAIDLYKGGMPVQDIQKMGRWKSNSVYDFLRC